MDLKTWKFPFNITSNYKTWKYYSITQYLKCFSIATIMLWLILLQYPQPLHHDGWLWKFSLSFFLSNFIWAKPLFLLVILTITFQAFCFRAILEFLSFKSYHHIFYFKTHPFCNLILFVWEFSKISYYNIYKRGKWINVDVWCKFMAIKNDCSSCSVVSS